MENEPKKIKLSNGVTVILRENHRLPIIAMSVCFLGGLLTENKKTNGIYHLWSQCVTKGTKKRSALGIAEAIEGMAGQLDGFSGKNSFGLRMEILSDYLQEGLDLFFEVLSEPAWDRKEVEKEKRLTIEAIKNQEDNLSALAFYHFQKNLFGNHPYGMRALGEIASVSKFTPKQLTECHRKRITAKNIVLGVVGNFSSASLLSTLEKKLAGLPKQAPPLSKVQRAVMPRGKKEIVTPKKKEQAHLVLGFLGPSFKSPDHYPMTVLNTLLSGMGGRLFVELRDKLSLAYSVTSVFQPGLDPGYFAVYIGTEPSKVPLARKAIETELKKIITTPVPSEELEKTKNHLVGTYELELQRNSGLAQAFAFDELYGQGYQEVFRYPEKILKVSPKDILAVAKKYINLERAVVSIVKPK